MTKDNTSTSQLIAKAANKDRPIAEDKNLPDLEVSLVDYQQQHQINSLEQQLQENIDNHKLRTKYANKIFVLVCVWLGCVIVTVLFVGFELYGFKLSDKVLMTFIATTTLNVLGIFAIVAKWMFQQNNKPSNIKNSN